MYDEDDDENDDEDDEDDCHEFDDKDAKYLLQSYVVHDGHGRK
jgi:hypothetical protein